MRKRHLSIIIVLTAATSACGTSPTEIDPTRERRVENEEHYLWSVSGQVRVNGIPRRAHVDLAADTINECWGTAYCIALPDPVVVAEAETDAEGRYALSGPPPRPIVFCDSFWVITARLTDPDVEDIEVQTSPQGECGHVTRDVAVHYVAVRGIVTSDGVPVQRTSSNEDAGTVRIEYPSGKVVEGSVGRDEPGRYMISVTAPEDESGLCSHFEGASLQVILSDGQTSDTYLLPALEVEQCAARPFIDLDVEV